MDKQRSTFYLIKTNCMGYSKHIFLHLFETFCIWTDPNYKDDLLQQKINIPSLYLAYMVYKYSLHHHQKYIFKKCQLFLSVA